MNNHNEETLRKVMSLKLEDSIPEDLLADLDELEKMSCRADLHFLSADVLALAAFKYKQRTAIGVPVAPADNTLVALFAFDKGDPVSIDMDGITRTGTVVGKGKKAGHYRVNIDGDDAAYKQLSYDVLTPGHILEPVEV
jgi:hypothetical protein